MKTVKRIVSALLALLLILSLAACMPSVPAPSSAPEQPIVLPTVAPDAPKEEVPAPETSAPTETQAPIPEETPAPKEEEPAPEDLDWQLDEHGSYTSKVDVALYIHTYGHLPDNFITKKEAEALGWEGGSLDKYAPGKCIGGTYFGNYEGLLPEKDGRKYYECDIDTLGKKSRGAKRIVYSNDGLIYYTDDHYESFTLLYGEE